MKAMLASMVQELSHNVGGMRFHYISSCLLAGLLAEWDRWIDLGVKIPLQSMSPHAFPAYLIARFMLWFVRLRSCKWPPESLSV
jgi:hypothetical protein